MKLNSIFVLASTLNSAALAICQQQNAEVVINPDPTKLDEIKEKFELGETNLLIDEKYSEEFKQSFQTRSTDAETFKFRVESSLMEQDSLKPLPVFYREKTPRRWERRYTPPRKVNKCFNHSFKKKKN